MNASGWRTAPPQMIDFEVVLVTNSACLLNGFFGVSDLYHPVAQADFVRPQTDLYPYISYRYAPSGNSTSCILSAPPVSCI